MFTEEDLFSVETRAELIALGQEKSYDIERAVSNQKYNIELALVQEELVKLQRWANKQKLRIAVLFEGRDAAGKGGAIKRFSEHLSPRMSRVVALSRPTSVESGQWYFRRYIKELPNPGEIVFFDRSWYNRAVVEPVMGFCDKHQYQQFMVQVPEFEHMLYEDGVILIKFWFSIAKDEQKKRFDSRMKNPLKQWKFSPVDEKGQVLWDDYTKYKEVMFSRTHTSYSPWIIVKANNKRTARLESIRYLLSLFEYDGKGESKTRIYHDPNVVMRFHREVEQIDI